MKLQQYGIQGNILSWISDFLSECIPHVVCGGSTSKPTNVTSGVPQGSVLGLLLFINDISINHLSSCYLFPDDCICIETSHQLLMLKFFKKTCSMGKNLGYVF